MNKTFLIILLLILQAVFNVNAQQAKSYQNPDSTDAAFEIVKDNFIVASLDSLSTLKYFENTENTKGQLYNNKYNFLPNFIPTYPDSVYYYRMQRLDVESPIELAYNPYVRSFIELYANKKRGTTARVLGLAQMYFPMIEQQLDKYNIPLELKYLAIVESALNAKARSRVGAGGLWQFMYYTWKVYGLNANSYVDDRNDPLKATVAACQHFRDLYNMYHDWLLVLAAYNSGAGNVNKAIRRSGGKMTLWEIMPYLPRETRDYVPAFIAVNYVMAYSNEHNIYPIMPTIVYHETDTVAVKQPISFTMLAEKLKLSTDEIEFLNPTFRQGFIPATPASPYYIRLPQKSIADFINNEEAFYAYSKLKGYDPTQYQNLGQDDYEFVTKLIRHKVRKGETLATIARRYDCSTSELKRWNKLKRSSVARGQSLKVYVQSRKPNVSKTTNNNTEQVAILLPKTDTTARDKTNTKNINTTTELQVVTNAPKYHVVKKGETLGEIASKYHVTTTELVSWNRLKKSNIISGQRLKVREPVVMSKAENAYNSEISANSHAGLQKGANTSSGKAVYHTVKKGEFLGRLAAKYGVTTADLIEWNKLGNNNLVIGQKLLVNDPAKQSDPALADQSKHKKAKDESTNDSTKLEYYVVRPGDTLWSISQKFIGVSIEQLKEWNKISGNSLKVGQKLKVIIPIS